MKSILVIAVVLLACFAVNEGRTPVICIRQAEDMLLPLSLSF